jgi:hypothetical protein
MTTRPNADRCPAWGGVDGGICSTQYMPVPGKPIETRRPRGPYRQPGAAMAERQTRAALAEVEP